MSFIFDFFPILAFFIFYKLYNIYIATAVTMAISCAQLAYVWFKHKKLDKTLLFTLVTILILGSATLILHDELFIKWKPTVLYWSLATFIVVRYILGYGSSLQAFLQDKILLDTNVWKNIDIAVATFLTLLGVLNLTIAYNFDTNTWVYFKLFGSLGLTLLFSIILSFYIAKNAIEIESNE